MTDEEEDLDGKIAVVSEEDARTILDNQVNIVNHIQSQGLGTLRAFFAVVAIMVTIVATGSIDFSPRPIGTPSQVSNFNQTVNATDLPAGLVASSTYASTLIYIIAIVLIIILVADSIERLWSLMSPAQLQPSLGEPTTSETAQLVATPGLASELQDKQLSIQFTNYIDWITENSRTIERRQELLSTGVLHIYLGGICVGLLLFLYYGIYFVDIAAILIVSASLSLVPIAFLVVLLYQTLSELLNNNQKITHISKLKWESTKRYYLPGNYIGFRPGIYELVIVLTILIWSFSSAILGVWAYFLYTTI